jgi:hypothetical protein
MYVDMTTTRVIVYFNIFLQNLDESILDDKAHWYKLKDQHVDKLRDSPSPRN